MNIKTEKITINDKEYEIGQLTMDQVEEYTVTAADTDSVKQRMWATGCAALNNPLELRGEQLAWDEKKLRKEFTWDAFDEFMDKVREFSGLVPVPGGAVAPE